MPNAVKIFFSYSHKDEALRDELATHLSMMKRQGVIEAWHDREITAGSEWANAIDENLEIADIILLLVSANFLASDYCYDKEMTRAMERYETREARVIPIILKPTDWNDAPFSKLQALPKNAKPITTWPDQDEAFLNVAQGIRRVVENIAKSKSFSSTAAGTTTPETSNRAATSEGLTERQRRRLEQERDSLEQQYDLVSKKLSRLRQAYSIETDVSVKFKLEKQIQETETELKQLDQQLEEKDAYPGSTKGIGDQPKQGDKFSYSEITISRSNEGANDIWDLKIGASEVPSASQNIRIKRGEKVVFTLPSDRYYTMSLHFTRTTFGYSFSGKVGQPPHRSWHTTTGVSNEWSGTFSPGEYYFECKPILNLLYLSLQIVTLNNYDKSGISLKLKSLCKW